MTQRSEHIRAFILNHCDAHPHDLVRLVCDEYDITRQAVNKHIRFLTDAGSLINTGSSRKPDYQLVSTTVLQCDYTIPDIQEDTIWRQSIRPLVEELPEPVVDIWEYGVTEMINNAIDHSLGSTLHITLKRTAISSTMMIADNGEGIFKHIARLLDLDDERHATLELAKGKLTTDPENHTGEGIFFSSRAFSRFAIQSGNISFSHSQPEPEDWVYEQSVSQSGTTVFMLLEDNSQHTLKDVFDKYASSDSYGFTKTVVPVNLVKYGNEKLVSRSQAKRLLAGLDRFKTIILDFDTIERIGQAFADEVFRVFRSRHPAIDVLFINTNDEINDMIIRALGREG